MSHWEPGGEKSVPEIVYPDSFSCFLRSIVFTIGLMLTKRLEKLHFLPVVLQPNTGHGLLILEVSRSHNDASHSVGLLWNSDQLVAETST
jgi:hypothetical protein